MEPFPFLRRPYYYYDRDRYINRYNMQNVRKLRKEDENTKIRQDIEQDARQKSKTKENEEFFLEIFGIKLQFDDILIIALIFFLYNEGVKDNSLFISLILLLLS